jgi:Transposase DDE domain
MDSLLELFCDVDDFCQTFEPNWNKRLLARGERQRQRQRSLTLSEIMTIVIYFHQSQYRNFKACYQGYVLQNLRAEFPKLVSYTRFVEFIPSVLIPLSIYLRTACFGTCSGISFIDSTSLDVCDNRRIAQHRVFEGWAERGKTSMGWFFGFKLHLVVNDRGEILNMMLTPGNIDDRKPVPELVRSLFGKLVGDRGYISQALFEELLNNFNIQFIVGIKSNMKNKLLSVFDKILLRKRTIIETSIDQLKNISQIEHSRHRSPMNFLVNLVCGLIAYCRQPKKPSLGFHAPINLLP